MLRLLFIHVALTLSLLQQKGAAKNKKMEYVPVSGEIVCAHSRSVGRVQTLQYTTLGLFYFTCLFVKSHLLRLPEERKRLLSQRQTSGG